MMSFAAGFLHRMPSATDFHRCKASADVITSYIERQNLTMRMSMRRFTRLTNAFSKKFENHCHSLALYFCWYNWIRKHKTLGTTPAVAAGLTDKSLAMADIAHLVDLREQSQIQQRRKAMLLSPMPQSN
jgi:hypothetical protein